MKNLTRSFKHVAAIIVILMLGSLSTAQAAPQISNLSFQADIFGGSGLETIEYVGDLTFYYWGGFGTNAHVFRSFLQGGDQIAYAVSWDNPNAFTFQVSPIGSTTPIILTITKAEYSTGIVTQPSPSELHFVWDVQKSGYHFKLHKKAILVSNSAVTAQKVINETFTVENLGTNNFSFTVVPRV